MNKHTIRNPHLPNRPAHSHHIMQMLGVTRLPAEGMSSREIQGVQVWVTPLAPKLPNQRKRHTHRVMCSCPDCGEVLSVGRLQQHVCDDTARAIVERAKPVMPTKKAPKVLKGFVLIHESEDGEELERSAQFMDENGGAEMLQLFARSINFFPGDSIRCVDTRNEENGK